MAAVTIGHDDHAHDDHHEHAPEIPYPVQLRSNRVGIWLFFVSELFLFVGLLAARFYLWRVSPEMAATHPTYEVGEMLRPELSQLVGFITTAMLLVSSYFMVRAEIAAEHGHRGKMVFSLWVTFILGLLFLLGVVIIEWGTMPQLATAITGHSPIRPTDGVFGAVLFAMTGMHAIHVTTGLIFILILIFNSRKGWYPPHRTWGVEACALYWHYVDVIWIFFYPALYLIGRTWH